MEPPAPEVAFAGTRLPTGEVARKSSRDSPASQGLAEEYDLRYIRFSAVLVLFLNLSCVSAKIYDVHGRVIKSCWTWGQASCSMVCQPIHIKDAEGKTVLYYTNNNCMVAISGGLSDNGADAIIDPILGMPAAIVKALIPGS